MIIGIIGFIGSGKDTAAEYLVNNYNYTQVGFADSLKVAVANIFGWDIELLQGHTKASRIWREQIDVWWSTRLNIPHLTPRWVLQQWGTEAGRKSFHHDIWIASIERKIFLSTNKKIVISDCRFKNEIAAITNVGGITIRINRGPFPIWYETALNELRYLEKFGYETGFESHMYLEYPDVHISEWGWINLKFDYEIDNSDTLQSLYQQLDNIIAKSLPH